jgi:uncharacterized protein YukE
MGDSETTLGRAMDDLEKKWQGTGDAWHDQAREDFEKEYLQDLTMAVKKAQQAMRTISSMLHEVIRECSL